MKDPMMMTPERTVCSPLSQILLKELHQSRNEPSMPLNETHELRNGWVFSSIINFAYPLSAIGGIGLDYYAIELSSGWGITLTLTVKIGNSEYVDFLDLHAPSETQVHTDAAILIAYLTAEASAGAGRPKVFNTETFKLVSSGSKAPEGDENDIDLSQKEQ